MNSIRKIGENIKNSAFFKGTVAYEVSLSSYTTMKVGGPAAVFVEPADALSAAVTVSCCKAADVRLFVLGGGSNLVVNDRGFEGVVLSSAKMNAISRIDGERVTLTDKDAPFCDGMRVTLCCGAGATMDSIMDYCAEEGLWGLTEFAGLPGTAGGAAFMNARCYEKNISDVLLDAKYLDFNQIPVNQNFNVESVIKMYHNSSADWGYKHSPFMEMHSLVTEVRFSCFAPAVCTEGVRNAILSHNGRFVQDRISKGHFRAPSSGSVFKNDRAFGKPSGALIDAAGLKGLSVGGAQVAPWHGNFIINTGNACADDVRRLVEKVQDAVKQDTGFMLEPEIIFI